MKLGEALLRAEEKYADEAYRILAAEVRRLQSEVERLPARRAKPTVKTAPIAPTNWPAWGMEE